VRRIRRSTEVPGFVLSYLSACARLCTYVPVKVIMYRNHRHYTCRRNRLGSMHVYICSCSDEGGCVLHFKLCNSGVTVVLQWCGVGVYNHYNTFICHHNPTTTITIHVCTAVTASHPQQLPSSVLLQWCYSGVTEVLQWCYSGVTVVLQWCCSTAVTAITPTAVAIDRTVESSRVPTQKGYVMSCYFIL
jgi:hypothetical protein